MLSGKIALTECCSLGYLGARSHLPSTPISRALPNLPSHRSKACNPRKPDCAATGTRVRFVSHVPPPESKNDHFTAIGRNEREPPKFFLKPRGKPKFRKPTNNEDQDGSHVSGGARNEHDVQQVQETRDEYEEADVTVTESTKSANTYLDAANATRSTRVPFHETSTDDLEQELLFHAYNNPFPPIIHKILRVLITDRGIKPSAEHYEALILANTWPEFGSVDNVENIILELESHNMEITTNIIAAVLKVLAVRPSFDLSHRMIALAERRWAQFPPQSQHDLILALIRTGQTDLAASMLDALSWHQQDVLEKEREIIPDYLIVLLLVEMSRLGDWEGVLRQVYRLRDENAADREIPVVFWDWLLEQSSKAARTVSEVVLTASAPVDQSQDVVLPGTSLDASSTDDPSNSADSAITSSPDGEPVQATVPPSIQIQIDLDNPAKHLTQWIWSTYVTSMSLTPPNSVCLDVLHIAVNTGTPWLAQSVVSVMTYKDGLDPHLHPKAHLSEEIQALVEAAQRRAEHNEAEKWKRQGKDVHVERAKATALEQERQHKERTVDDWWSELFAKFDAEKSDQRASNIDTAASGAAIAVAQAPRNQDPDVRVNDTSSSQERLRKVDETSPVPPLDPATAPPGSLWPYFANLDGTGSAHVDPWDALGRLNSARQKWTAAQEYFKGIERTTRGIEKRSGAKPMPKRTRL